MVPGEMLSMYGSSFRSEGRTCERLSAPSLGVTNAGLGSGRTHLAQQQGMVKKMDERWRLEIDGISKQVDKVLRGV
jgi:hypothetical protein